MGYMPETPTKSNHVYLIYMYKENLTLNNLNWFFAMKTNPTQPKPSRFQLTLSYSGFFTFIVNLVYYSPS